MSASLLRGRLVCPGAAAPFVAVVEDGLVRIEAGRITSVCPVEGGSTHAESHPGCVLMPGLVDTHVHYPQTRIIGRASGPLLDWLETVVFPEEARFDDLAYAGVVADAFCDALLAGGSTCAAVYGSSHPGATNSLFETLGRRGLRGMAGLTLMDRGAPDSVCLGAGAALDACLELIEKWHGHDDGRLQYCITPRFALTCSEALLRGAGDLAQAHGLPIQTHLSEHPAELQAVAEIWPGHRDYLAVYEDCGLVTSHTIFGHCIWLSDDEWDRVADAGSAIAHCPDSNAFLGSGDFPIRQARARNIRVGLGSDVGAGRTFSILRAAEHAYHNALRSDLSLDPAELIWLATFAGARALGLHTIIGRLLPGYEADIIAVPIPEDVSGEAALLDALVFRHDAPPITAAYVRGRRVW